MEHTHHDHELDSEATNNTHATILSMALAGGTRVLDLGSGPGIVAAHLAGEHGRSVTCLDADQELLAVAKERGIASTIVADLNTPDWPDTLEGRQFDVVILAGILEHLASPEAVLAAIAERKLLADGGFLVVAIPNAAHEAVIAELLTGHFTYHPTGPIRFFTRDSFVELAADQGFAVTEIRRTLRTRELTEVRERVAELDPEVRRIVTDRGLDAQTYQLIMRLVPLDADGGADLRRRVDQLSEANAELSARNAELEEQVGVLRGGMAEAALAAQQLNNSLKTDLRGAKRSADESERRAARLSDEIDVIHDSFTWKAGRVVKRAVDPAIAARAALMRRVGRRGARLSKRPRARTGRKTPRDEDPAVPTVDPGSQAASFAISEHPLRSEYEGEVRRATFAGSGGRKVVIAIHTADLAEGRGDVYVAAGIGRRMREAGADVAYLPRDRWHDLPGGTDTVIAMLPTLRPSRIPSGVRCIAWVRNEVDAWLDHPEVRLFDGILASSERSRIALSRVFTGPTGVLRIGVDIDLFSAAGAGTRHGVVGTVNLWGRERDVHRALRSAPVTFPLALYGRERGLHPSLVGYGKGPVSYFALPGLYSQAVVALDDFNHTTVRWGNVNSRLYEALACGALVVTNTGLGLDETGLGEVPTFEDEPDLHAVVNRLLADPGGTAALAARLTEVVRTRHGFADRSRELLAFLDRVEREPHRGHRVLAFYPGTYRHGNPYQQMLYTGLGELDTVAIPTDDPFEPSGFDGFTRADGARVLHIHWTAPILGGARGERDAVAIRRRLLDGIDTFRAGGGRLVWTVHNVLPHECAHPTVEAGLRQGLADRADAVHVMCDATAAAVSEHYTLPADRTFVVPHSSFVGVYGDAMHRGTARTGLGVADGDIVLLALGGIRPYKAIDRLLDSLDRALATEPRLRLVVAGKPGRFPGVVELEQRCQRHPRVIARFEPVPAEELQMYFKAADVAVLPHRAVLNSGGLLLAYTFGCPVIAPTAGCLVDALDPGASIGFDPGDENSLAVALSRAGSLLGPEHGRAARAIAERYNPPDMAGDFATALARVIG